VNNINRQTVAVLGASSLVGANLLPLLRDAGCVAHAFSRSHRAQDSDGINWHICSEASLADIPNLKLCVCAAPIWVLPEFFPQLLAAGVRRVVTLSSTSVFTRQDSLDMSERRLSKKILDTEHNVRQWAQVHGVECVILRPTLIYGSGADKSIVVIAKFIKRFGFFPILGKASGLRQPVHARDVARACVSALHLQGAKGMDFNLSGAETLTYREMVSRVFVVLGLKPRLVTLPSFAFRLGFFVLRLMPRYRHWSMGMALRMNHDQTFNHSQAASVLGFSPQGFTLDGHDLPAEPKG
jgi:nucleoside-diphosphate-sugar epimerase